MRNKVKENEQARNVHPEHFDAGFSICLSGGFSPQMAIVMSKGFARRGMTDAAAGCDHYALTLMVKGDGNNGD